LHRDQAEKLILDVISDRIFSDGSWKSAVFNETLAAWKKRTHQQPGEIQRLENALADVERKIQRLMDSIEAGDDPEIRSRLQQRRREKESLTKDLRQAQQLHEKTPDEPTLEWVEAQLANLSNVLKGQNPTAALALRNLVGGRIQVSEIQQVGRKRFFFSRHVYPIDTPGRRRSEYPAVRTIGEF